jgi:hypothetical protein
MIYAVFNRADSHGLLRVCLLLMQDEIQVPEPEQPQFRQSPYVLFDEVVTDLATCSNGLLGDFARDFELEESHLGPAIYAAYELIQSYSEPRP